MLSILYKKSILNSGKAQEAENEVEKNKFAVHPGNKSITMTTENSFL